MNRETSHLIVETINGKWFIISSLASRRDTQVISIERYTGRLIYNGQPGVDLFESPKDALHKISMGQKILKTIINCHVIIGYLIIGNVGYLLVATKVSPDLILPPEHRVYTIQETTWIQISLGYPNHLPKAEQRNGEIMMEYPMNGLHFYCETLDLTRPYPSTHHPYDYESEFCWNDFMSLEFKKIGMREWCCVLLQGLAMGKHIKNYKVDDKEYDVNVALITKRSSLNPGTRYLSRGLNSKSSPGNEYEFEQILWKISGDQVSYASCVWRRGTVPLHWKSKINSQFADAIITIDEKPYENVDLYYKRIISRYGNSNISCVNLLRGKAYHPDEAMLTAHFKESIKVVKKLMNIDVTLINYDWHANFKTIGLHKTVENLWYVTGSKLRETGFTSGLLQINEKRHLVNTKIWTKQQGIIRVNCADSLDRTNLTLFFLTLQVVAEQCKQIDVPLITNNQESWVTLDYTVEKLRESFDENLLIKLAEMFVANGDICALLFTNTVAMHTSPIREFAQHLPPARSNTQIIVERRYQNVIKDKTRQAQYEIFLGINLEKYFPTCVQRAKGGRLRYVTPYPAYIFKTLPSRIDGAKEELCLLEDDTKFCWICPRDYDFVEVHAFLPFYCRVTELSITIRHGVDESTSPSKMDVFVGSHLDDCSMGFQELQLPRCDDGTKLLYTLPPQISGIKENCKLYDFEGRVASSKMRVVRITFHGIAPGAHMTLGQIQVYGIHEESDKPPKKFQWDLMEERSYEKAKQLVKLKEEKLLDLSMDDEKEEEQPETIQEPPKEDSNVIKLVDDYFAQKTLSVTNIIPRRGRHRRQDSLSLAKQRQAAKQRYTEILLSKIKSSHDKLSFNDVLELDLARLQLKLTPQQRDTILIENGFKVLRFDPNQYLFYRDEKVEAALRKKYRTSNCHLCNASVKLRKYSCRYCRFTFCKACTHKEKFPIHEYMWTTPQKVCISCAEAIQQQETMLKEINELIIEEEKEQIRNSKNINEKLFHQLYPALNIPSVLYKMKDATCLSEFPSAGILSSVETAEDSPPIESILFPSDILSEAHYWSAPIGTNQVHIIIVLPCFAKINKVIMLADALGYHGHDLPEIQLAIAERLPKFHFHETWNLCDKKDIQPKDLCIAPFQRVDLNLTNGVKGRLVQLTLQLSNLKDSESFLHLGRILIFGDIIGPVTRMSLTSGDQKLYDEILQIKPKSTKLEFKTEIQHLNRETNTLDMVVNGQYISGFKIYVKHGADGITSQVKEIRVSLFTKNEKNELVNQNVIGQYIIPKVANGVALAYEFPKTYDNVDIVRFEFLSNYGAQSTSIGKIQLYYDSPNL